MTAEQRIDSVHSSVPFEPVPKGVSNGTALPSNPMVVAAAKAMAKLHAEACNVDKDDLWIVNGPEFLDEAQAVLEACGALELQAVMQLAMPLLEGCNSRCTQDTAFIQRARTALSSHPK